MVQSTPQKVKSVETANLEEETTIHHFPKLELEEAIQNQLKKSGFQNSRKEGWEKT